MGESKTSISRKPYQTRALALIWFSLCASLVLTRIELALVFFSFMGSSAAASLVSLAVHPPNPMLIRNSIGILVYAISFILILSSISLRSIIQPSLESKQPEFHALALITGYLVFDLWYTVVHFSCKPGLLQTVWENALTLSIFVTILAKLAPVYALGRYRAPALVWICYRVCKIIWEIHYFPLNYKKISASTKLIDPPSPQAKPQICISSPLTTNLWVIHGVEFDLSDFVQRHPGGVEAIELGRGRDCTAMFESYHPFTDKHWDILVKYAPPGVDMKQLKLASTDPFYESLKRRAYDLLRQNGVNPESHRGATTGRAIYYLLIFIGLLISAGFHVKGYLVGSFVFSIFAWLIGALGHDAGHRAVSRKAWINDVCLWGISTLCNPIMWQHQHTFAHHSHTNDFHQDPDLHHFQRLLRVHHRFKYESIYAYQRNRIYVIFSYALVVFGTCLWIPIQFLRDGTLYGIVDFTNKNSLQARVSSLAHVVGYTSIILIAPFFHVGALKATACGVIHMATAGLLFAFFSQINHVNEVSFSRQAIVLPDSKPDISSSNTDTRGSSWAMNQILSSNNFASSSLFWHIFSNGLNMQIEHHLFPGLNHCHLHLVKRAVEDTCREHSLEYKEYESFGLIFEATMEWLDVLSKPS